MIIGLVDDQKINSIDNDYDENELRELSAAGQIICPACGKPYKYCHGDVKIPYFRHVSNDSCEDRFGEAETEEHLLGKTQLFNWLKTLPEVEYVELEAWLPETRQKPDILFRTKNGTYVLEYQCTPIAEQYRERRKLYKKAGVVDFWICGTSKYNVTRGSVGTFERYRVWPDDKNKGKEMKRLGREIERTADGFYNPFTNEITLRGRMIFERLKNKAVYPSPLYTYPLEKSKMSKYGPYAPEFYKAACDADQHWQSNDTVKSMKQHIQTLSAYLEDSGCQFIRLDSYSNGKSGDNLATLKFTDTLVGGKYLMFIRDGNMAFKCMGYYSQGRPKYINFNSCDPAALFNSAVRCINSGEFRGR